MDVPIRSLETQTIAPDTHVIRQLVGEGVAPVATHVNSMVITGSEPVIVDTAASVHRDAWLEHVFAVVDPADVRWIYLSHDDIDHTGNLLPVLDLCPDAQLVTNWFSVERMSADGALPLDRMRWVNDGESFVAGDRELVAVTPPIYDSPTTRGLFDTKSGVYWAADAFGSPVTHEVGNIAELDPAFYREAFVGQQLMIGPWLSMVDPAKYQAALGRLQALGASSIASCHGVTLQGAQIDSAFELLTELPYREQFVWPGQAELDAMHEAMLAGAV